MKKIPLTYKTLKECPRYLTSRIVLNKKTYVDCAACAFSSLRGKKCRVSKWSGTIKDARTKNLFDVFEKLGLTK